jgi:hypothetical protein
MSDVNAELRRRHASLQSRSAALFRALDARDPARIAGELDAFLIEVESYVRRDVAGGYRLLLHHPSEPVRRTAERLNAEHAHFQPAFDAFCARWREADESRFLEPLFRDELETLVSNLLKRIRIEERLHWTLSSVA